MQQERCAGGNGRDDLPKMNFIPLSVGNREILFSLDLRPCFMREITGRNIDLYGFSQRRRQRGDKWTSSSLLSLEWVEMWTHGGSADKKEKRKGEESFHPTFFRGSEWCDGYLDPLLVDTRKKSSPPTLNDWRSFFTAPIFRRVQSVCHTRAIEK